MQKNSQFERYSRKLLYFIFQTAKLLGIIHGNFDPDTLKVHRYQRRNKMLSRIFSTIIVFIYWGVLPHMFHKVSNVPKSYFDIFASAQTASVTIFAVFSFVVQSRKEGHFIKILNRYFCLHRHILAKTSKAEIFTARFLLLLLLKILATMFGLFNEIPALLQVKNILDFSYWISVIIGIYMWLGSMFVLDACFLGFLVIATMYGHMSGYIQHMICGMRHIELEIDENGKKLSHFRRMNLLCNYSDDIDETSAIYTQLDALTKQFQCIFQWQILYYIYYNFMVILMLLHQCIWQYLESNFIDIISLFLVTVKIGNLTLLVMCAHYAVDQSQLPGLLCLDVVCSDIDVRWDKSVQSFLSQRKFENFEIKILGIFQLNNEFILLLLSAIISYLFILIQFGITGGFNDSTTTVEQLKQRD